MDNTNNVAELSNIIEHYYYEGMIGDNEYLALSMLTKIVDGDLKFSIGDALSLSIQVKDES
jgi:hypothetical protein